MQIPKIINRFLAVILKPFGRMNKDIDIRYIKEGDCIDALNCRSMTDKGGSTMDREAILGNLLVYNTGAVTAQNKWIRIYVDASVSGDYSFDAFTPNKLKINSLAMTASVTVGDIMNTLGDIANVIDQQLFSDNQSSSCFNLTDTGNDTGYLDVMISTVLYWDYYIDNSSSATINARFETVRESIDESLSGNLQKIGSFDLNEENIEWYTSQTDFPSELSIDSVSDDGTGQPLITLSQPHGILDNSLVIVKNTTSYNGQWIVLCPNDDEIILLSAVFAGDETGVVTVNPSGIGEIGRSVKNSVTGNWTYTRLIRSKKFNFVTKKQIDSHCEKDEIQKSYYFTDDYNNPFAVYDRTISYQDDCLLNFIDPKNIYNYDTLGFETKLIVSQTGADFRFISQDQTGGNIQAGNSRYAVRFLTEVLSVTEWSLLTNPIPAGFGNETVQNNYDLDIWGLAAGNTTTKANNFLLTGSVLSIFKYVELGVITYIGDTKQAYIVRRELITGTEMTLTHTGYEIALQDLDAGTLQQVFNPVTKALNIASLENRLFLSNIETADNINLAEWFQTWECALTVEPVDIEPQAGLGMGNWYNVYWTSNNVYSKTGYMLNERYRFGAIAEFIDGSKSPVYWINDVVFNTQAQTRVTPLSDYRLTNSGETRPLTYGIDFYNMDFDAIVDSVRVGDVVKRIYIMRAEVVNKQILASGVIIPSVYGTYATGITQYEYTDLTTSGVRGEFPFVAGLNANLGNILNYYYGQTGGSSDFSTDRTYVSFYTSDLKASIEYRLGDKILNYGQPEYDNSNFPTSFPSTNTLVGNYWMPYNGYADTTPDEIDIIESVNVGFGQYATIAGQVFSKIFLRNLLNYCNVAGGLVFKLGGNADRKTAFSGQDDRALYMAQYYRPLTSEAQYGNINNTQYVYTGAVYDGFENEGVIPQNFFNTVFGGDVFTQPCYLKTRYQRTNANQSFGQGITFYSQNRANFNYRQKETANGLIAFPQTSGGFQGWLENVNAEDLQYQSGYTIRNEVQRYAAYDPNGLVATDHPVMIVYSQKKVPGQVSDNYRIFLPFDFTNLEYTYGEIVGMLVGNGELYTVQPDKFDRHYINSNTLVNTTNGAEIIIGDGGIFTRKPLELSSYGCSHKWSFIKGISDGGNDVLYWYCDRYKALMRFGYDGTTQQSIIKGMDSWFKNNTKFVSKEFTPADNKGIHGVWNDRFKEFILTVRGWRSDINEWESGSYITGDYVWYETELDVPVFYVCTSNTSNPPTDNLSWRRIPFTNNDFYNVWTIVLSEYKNGFDYFASFVPKIYTRNGLDITSSHQGFTFEHNRGEYLIWYTNPGQFKNAVSNGYWKGVFNYEPEENKRWRAVRVYSDLAPYQMDFETLEHRSYLVRADFEQRDSKWESAIRNDSTVSLGNPSGLNSEDTDVLWGQYMIVSFYFYPQEYQRLYSLTARCSLMPRLRNT